MIKEINAIILAEIKGEDIDISSDSDNDEDKPLPQLLRKMKNKG